MRNFRMLAVGASLLALLFSACTTGDGSPIVSASPSGAALPTVVVGANSFTESQVVAEIYAQALEAHGFTVERQLDLGPRTATYALLQSGDITLMPEYIGSLTRFLGGEATSDSDETRSALVALLQADGLTALDNAPGQDADGFAVRADTATQFGLATMTDAARVSDQLTWGLPPECATNPSCGPGLLAIYGIDISQLEVAAFDACSAAMIAPLVAGAIDIAEVCTTQAAIEQFSLVLLADDGGLAPAQNVVPVVSQALVDDAGAALTDVLNAVSAELTTEELTLLGFQVDISHDRLEDVAHKWLTDHGMV